MEARPVRKQRRRPMVLFMVSALTLLSFLSLSMVTKNFNYTAASFIAVMIINLSVAFDAIRHNKKRSLKDGNSPT